VKLYICVIHFGWVVHHNYHVFNMLYHKDKSSRLFWNLSSTLHDVTYNAARQSSLTNHHLSRNLHWNQPTIRHPISTLFLRPCHWRKI